MKRNRHSPYTAGLFLLLAIGFAPSEARADITVVRSLRLKSRTASGSIQAHNIMQLRGRAVRKDTEVLASGSMAHQFHYPVRTITVVSLDKATVHHLDLAKDTNFEKIPLSHWAKYLTDKNQSLSPTGFQISQSWSRVIPEDTVKMIKGQRCTKFTYEWRFEISNPETYAKKQYGVRTTLWLTELSPTLLQTLQEERVFQADYRKRLGGTALEDLNAVTMEYASQVIGLEKEVLFAGLNQGTTHLKKIAGYPMASLTEWYLVGSKTNKSLFTVSSELEALSLKPIDASAFLPTKKSIPTYDESGLTAQLMAKSE
jgi:hypothetical protein